MSAKLIVHKFENESDYKSLNILIENNGDVKKISQWQDGISELKKKDKDKSRLVVKIISEENLSLLDLDSCAQKVDKSESYFNNIFVPNPIDLELEETNKNGPNIENRLYDYESNKLYNEHLESYMTLRDIDESEERFKKYFKSSSFVNDMSDALNPLEYSLERVKENNARIMENIHILNRTLNYTKKRDINNPKILRSYPCDECGKCFVYETGLRRHYAVRHACFDTQPRWQLVWTCTECFQVWPQQDLAMEHAKQCCRSDNIDCVREIKTSSLLQCEFCEKVFTSIPRLLRHLKLHTVTNNYECNACDIAFSCYKTAEQHWVACMWLKMYYQFTLPKLLLCNACDRKFRNYDQLYNHR